MSAPDPHISPVVVEVDGTADGLRVVDFATREALRCGTDLVLVRPYRDWQGSGRRRDEAGRELRAALAHVRRQVGYRVTARTVAREGSRRDVLAQLSRTAQLLVIARQRVRGPQRLVAAQDDLVLASHSRSPVVVVPRTWKPDSGRTAVAVGVDGTQTSSEAVGYAFAAAARRRVRLLVVHAEAGPPGPVTEADELAWRSRAGLTVAETLAGWQQGYPEVDVERLLSTEPVSQALTRWSARAGLLVLGVHTDRNRMYADPIAREALAAATCPVAMVRHHVTARGTPGWRAGHDGPRGRSASCDEIGGEPGSLAVATRYLERVRL
jgi:Universal stress protein family